MTTKDTTGEKLIASIRKTKAGSEAPETTTAKKVVKKAPVSRKKKVAPAKKTKVTPAARKPTTVSFTHGRRVWPD